MISALLLRDRAADVLKQRDGWRDEQKYTNKQTRNVGWLNEWMDE